MLLLSLVFKIGLFLYISNYHPIGFMGLDAKTYYNPALSLLHSGSFSSNPNKPYHPESLRTPGYPLFLAFILKIFGELNVKSVIIIQIMLGFVVIFFAYYLGIYLFSERAALYAAFLVAFDPSLNCMQNMVMTESVFTLVLIIVVFLFFVKVNHFPYSQVHFG